MSELAEISQKIDGMSVVIGDVKSKVDRLDQGINGGDGAVGLATQVHSHEKFIRENRPMIVLGRMLTYAGIGSVGSIVVMYVLRDTILKLIGGG